MRINLPGGKRRALGYFSHEAGAARAYDAAVIAHGLSRTKLNFPNSLVFSTASEAEASIVERASLRAKTKASKWRGVYFFKRTGKWEAQISIEGHLKYLGYYVEELDAAQAYDNGVRENGLNRPLNFPRNQEERSRATGLNKTSTSYEKSIANVHEKKKKGISDVSSLTVMATIGSVRLERCDDRSCESFLVWCVCFCEQYVFH